MPPGKGTRRVYTVETDPKGGWRGAAKGSTRAVAKGDKAEVVKRTIEVAKKQPKAQVRIKGPAESRRSAPTLGAATLRELRARPICGNRIKVAAYQRRQWIRSKEEGSEASRVPVSVAMARSSTP